MALCVEAAGVCMPFPVSLTVRAGSGGGEGVSGQRGGISVNYHEERGMSRQ